MKKTVRDFFSSAQEELLVTAIKEAEKNTSGEIRVHLESTAQKDHYEHAQRVFEQLGMTKTEARNGVLFYLAVNDKRFVILGDQGIDDQTPENFWSGIKEDMQNHFKSGAFVQGLESGIKQAGKALQEFFPYQSNDQNELPDEISKS